MAALVGAPDLHCKRVHGCPCPMHFRHLLGSTLSRHPCVAAVPDQYQSFFKAGPLESLRPPDPMQSGVPATAEIEGQDSAACLTMPAVFVCTGYS